jgi:hypothetical protein
MEAVRKFLVLSGLAGAAALNAVWIMFLAYEAGHFLL